MDVRGGPLPRTYNFSDRESIAIKSGLLAKMLLTVLEKDQLIELGTKAKSPPPN